MALLEDTDGESQELSSVTSRDDDFPAFVTFAGDEIYASQYASDVSNSIQTSYETGVTVEQTGNVITIDASQSHWASNAEGRPNYRGTNMGGLIVWDYFRDAMQSPAWLLNDESPLTYKIGPFYVLGYLMWFYTYSTVPGSPFPLNDESPLTNLDKDGRVMSMRMASFRLNNEAPITPWSGVALSNQLAGGVSKPFLLNDSSVSLPRGLVQFGGIGSSVGFDFLSSQGLATGAGAPGGVSVTGSSGFINSD